MISTTSDVQLAAREAAGEAPAVRPRARGPRRGFKHWTASEDERLREIVLTSLDRLGTLQAIAKECHAMFKRDEGSVLRRIRHLRQADPAFDAAVASRVSRARALAEENKAGDLAAIRPDEPPAGVTRQAVAQAETPAPATLADTPRPAPAGDHVEESRLLAKFLEENSGPITGRQKARLADLVLTHGQVAVMAALADSLLHRADVILNDVEARLARSK